MSAGHKATIEDKRCWLKCFSVQIFDSTLSFLSFFVSLVLILFWKRILVLLFLRKVLKNRVALRNFYPQQFIGFGISSLSKFFSLVLIFFGIFNFLCAKFIHSAFVPSNFIRLDFQFFFKFSFKKKIVLEMKFEVYYAVIMHFYQRSCITNVAGKVR